MPTITAPPNVRVSWSCARCGYDRGWAQTRFPVEPTMQDAMWPTMLNDLKRYLVLKHHRAQGCVAIPDDFSIGRYRG